LLALLVSTSRLINWVTVGNPQQHGQILTCDDKASMLRFVHKNAWGEVMFEGVPSRKIARSLFTIFFALGLLVTCNILWGPQSYALTPETTYRVFPSTTPFRATQDEACREKLMDPYYEVYTWLQSVPTCMAISPSYPIWGPHTAFWGYETRAVCPDGTIADANRPYLLRCGGATYWSTGTPQDQLIEQSCPVGNPIRTGTGTKIQTETDFAGAGAHPLALQRTYRSSYLANATNGFGLQWMHQWQRRLIFDGGTAVALRGDGSARVFTAYYNLWLTQGVRDTLEPVRDSRGVIVEWNYFDAGTETTEVYDAIGALKEVRERNGWKTSLLYSDGSTPLTIAPRIGMLVKVQNQFGQSISFAYDSAGRIAAVTLPNSAVTRYAYDADGRLTSVTWPDGKLRTYHYEDAQSKGALTGITDETGVRFATWTYDAQGRAISSEHTGGVDKVQVQYLSKNQSTVTSADGSSRTYSFELAGNVLRPTSVSAPCPECGNVAKTTAYDTSGNVSSRVDFDNRETRYNYDARGRETQRIEGYGSADAKTTTTEWHPTWNLPLKVAAPGRVDYFSYDAKGQVLAYSWYQTNDANGSQGLNAQPSGDVTSTNWTYDANGLVATAVDKLGSTVTGQWAFTYDAQGNLASVANMAGQTGSAVQYDAAGRLLEAVDVSGSRIKYAYDGRGRMTDVDNDGIHTKYEYDAVGQLVGIIGPYDLVTRYTYDAAHRLIQILDNITIPEAVNDFGLVSPFTVEGAAAPSSLAYVSNRLASGWNVVIRWLKDWLSAVISSAQAQAIPLPNQYVPPIRPGQSLPAYPGSSAAPDLDPSLTPAKVAPGMYVLRFLVKIQKGCGTAVEAIKEVFDMSKPPGDCDEDEHRRLQENVNQACDNSGQLKCKVDDVKEVLMQKMTLSRRCALARTKINDACFRGGDGNHRREAQKRWGTFDNCEKLFNKLN
jgi:YD repeat-containing protein